jgi:NAD(P)-dependent dehydrogenase (short-subunit alcohol dehydrogenase family)
VRQRLDRDDGVERRVLQPVVEPVADEQAHATLRRRRGGLRGAEGQPGHRRVALARQEPRGRAVAAADVAHRVARADLRGVRHALGQLPRRLLGRLVAAQPEAVVDVLPPDAAVGLVERVVVPGDVVGRGAVSGSDDRGMVGAMPVAIVTGGNSGIGRAAVDALADAGFDIGLTWHSEQERADEAVEAVRAKGRRAEARKIDLHESDRAGAVVDELADALGGLDVLVNNAGYGTSTPFVDISLEDFRGVVEVDLIAPFETTKAAAKRMIAAGTKGRIINVTSVHEHIPIEGSGPYTASKHALGGFTKVAALELGKHGITVNAVAPGQIATRMTGQEDQEPEPSDGIPLGRAGDAREIAAIIAFLTSPGAAYITGESIVADGGLRLIAASYQ